MLVLVAAVIGTGASSKPVVEPAAVTFILRVPAFAFRYPELFGNVNAEALTLLLSTYKSTPGHLESHVPPLRSPGSAFLLQRHCCRRRTRIKEQQWQ